ncbi:MAG: efflux RND transporter periplasmic adaptor subunit [Lachnospiraceae bacterium]|nr:efflux RND transporter periplasmic adaptor subunit [Lachnospiraceae bacterium]
MLRINRKIKTFLLLAMAFLLAVMMPSMGLSTYADEAEKDLYFGEVETETQSKIETVKVTRDEFFVTGAANGEVRYNKSSAVFNMISEGTVRFQEYMVGTGTEVKKGDPIARITVELDASEIAQLQLELAIKEDDLDNYISDTKKLLDIYSRKAENSEDADEKLMARLAYDRLFDDYSKKVSSMEDEITSMVTRIELLTELLNTEYITANMDGVVSQTNWLRRGSSIGAWTYICSIIDKSDITVVVPGGSDLMRYNMPVKIYQTNGNKEIVLTGRVKTLKTTAISTNLTAEDDIIEVYGDPSDLQVNKDVVVRFDRMYVPDALTLPKTAVKSDNKGSYVNLMINGFTSKRYVVVGGTGARTCWIASGVEEGDLVAVN